MNMKIKKYTLAILSLSMMLSNSSCTDWLIEENETNITVDAIYNNPEALSQASVGLYYLHRGILRKGDNNDSEMFVGFLRGTDIEVSTDGSMGAPAFGYYRYTELATYRYHKRYWDLYYNIIGKANEIIFYGDKMEDKTPGVIRAIAEARYFRALSYLTLWERYENIYLNIIPTTPDNVNDERVYSPATKEQIFKQIVEDLDMSINDLDITDLGEPGRITKGAARHVRMLAAMWLKDYDEAIRQGEEIKKSNVYDLVPLNSIFGKQKLDHKEVIASWQYYEDLGGADYAGQWGYSGHRLKSVCIPEYQRRNGGERSETNGGYGRAWLFPNNYLLSLYDKEHDKRYEQFYRHEYYYTNEKAANADGKKVGDVIEKKGNAVDDVKQLHTGLRKYEDITTYPINDSKGFSDVIQYRYAQTCIMMAEAYLMKNDQTNAKLWFNKTWERAGNDKRVTDLTLQDIMDEHARELALEGHRWAFLKRIGKLEEQIKLHAGEDGYNIEARENFKPFMVRWPIPQEQLAQFGDSYPQNEGWPR